MHTQTQGQKTHDDLFLIVDGDADALADANAVVGGGGDGGARVDCKMRYRTMNAQQLKFRLGRKLNESDLLIQNESAVISMCSLFYSLTQSQRSHSQCVSVEREHLSIVSSCADLMLSSSLPNIRMYQWRMRLNLNLHECGAHEMASTQAAQVAQASKQVTTNL